MNFKIKLRRRFIINAIEFYTKPRHGTIKIPEKYKNIPSDELKVILLFEEKKLQRQKVGSFLDFVQENKCSLPKNFVFKREELYER
jgi:hypothetical protein